MRTLASNNYLWTTPLSLKFASSPYEKKRSENMSPEAMESVLP
ncbi:hypothetical protein SAMN04490205_3146 [Pseudomonas trivialis]|uniref:Transposase n=1 Tax=Pseudomonas trivialis TaxID=200450 RepID=A0ABY0UGH5_9PSED|nr:hypothetical protein SAMN04490205_3146 [Pseudomonas trivialis]